MPHPTQIHATCVALPAGAVLLRGAAGCGKSGLALRLIVEAGAQLVADDRSDLAVRDGRLIASAPAALAGRIEARGVGILALPYRAEAAVGLVADLTPDPDRLPEPACIDLLGVALARVELDARDPAAVAKLQLALGAGGARILRDV
jgi:serine kinase of HPr protein (carbohydrate metabolism regulator)